MAKVQEYKKKIVKDIAKLIKQYPIIGIVNMENIPAPQLQAMKAELRGKIHLFMTKKRLMKIAIEQTKNEKKHIEELEKYFEGMPALIFTNENPFRLSRILQKSKTSAPAKAGQTAPDDIIIKKGPTPFAPGPVISELSSVGLKVGVESGKVAVKEDTVVAKKGEKIKPKVAEILTRLDIKPMQVGLGLVAAYENGVIYQKDVLEVDEKAFNAKVNLAATQAFNLAFNITYPTKDNISLLIAKAFNDAKAIGISQEIFDKGIIEDLLSKAERSMLSLKVSADIETKAQETKEEPKIEPKAKEESPKEEPKSEVKEEKVKPEVKEPKIEKEEKPHVKEEVKKETPKQKEEEALEEEKEIIKEEKKLEEKPEQEQTPQEEEVQEAVKEEEEKQLEQERIEKEEEVQKAEEVDKKVKIMVEQTKKFAEGTEETAADILEEVEEEEKKPEEPKEEDKEKVPSTHDLKKQKEAKEDKKDKERKEVENLTKELLKKGTLRKK